MDVRGYSDALKTHYIHYISGIRGRQTDNAQPTQYLLVYDQCLEITCSFLCRMRIFNFKLCHVLTLLHLI